MDSEPKTNDTQTDKEKISLTANQAVILADHICGLSAQKTADRLGLSRSAIQYQRKRVNKFLNKSFDVDGFRPRMLGLLPAALESLAYHLSQKNLEATLKYLTAWGLLPKDRDELMEMLAALGGTANRPDTHLHLTFGDNGNDNGNSSGHVSRFARIYTEASQNSRFDPSDS